MILPAAWDVWTAVHESGHATVAQAFGVKVHSVSIVSDGETDGRCDTADETFPDGRAMLCYTLAGVIAVKHGWPDHGQLALGGGGGANGDLRRAEQLVIKTWGRENLSAAFNAGLATTEALVAEFWPEIVGLAVRLLAEKRVVF